jgi:SET domain-containing protein
MLNPKIRKRQKSRGEFGLFAGDAIAANEFIWMPHPNDSNRHLCLSMEEILRLPPAEREIFLNYCYQVDMNLFSGYVRMEDVESDDANFMNHSCDPNCWYAGTALVSRRPIAAGEEITYDYATDTTSREWGFSCACGSRLCRGTVTSGDWRKMLDVYRGHFIDYMNRYYCPEEALLEQKIS